MSDIPILFLEPQPCIRALKYAMGLKSLLRDQISICFGYFGHSLNRLYGYGGEFFDRTLKFDSGNKDEVKTLIDEFKPVLIHSHNAPNTLTISAIQASKNIPVIHDVHEVLSVHNSGFTVNDHKNFLMKYRAEEKKANEESDGRIYVSEGVRDYIRTNYNVNQEAEMVFRNYVSESVIPKKSKEKLSDKDGEVHIAYIGCVTSVVKNSHYDLREVFREIADKELNIHIYPSSNLITQSNRDYQELADANEYIHFHRNMDHRKLLKEITQYDYGWAGFNGIENEKHTDIAFQNKIIEYICSGLPLLAFPHKTIKNFIEKYKIGIVFKRIKELKTRLGNVNLSKMRKNTIRLRDEFSLEKRIPQIFEFYKRIIENS